MHKPLACAAAAVALTLASAAAADAPTLTPTEAATGSSYTPGPHSVSLAYYGHLLTHPGVSLGYSYRVLESPGRLHALVAGAELGTYVWPRHDIGLFLTPRIGWRGRAECGLQGEFDFNLGWLQGFIPGTVYEVVGDEVRETTVSFPYLWFGLSTGIGWNFAGVGGVVDIAPFLRLGVSWQYPMFDQLLIRVTGAVGVEVRL